jgi:hypothetical protein
MAEPIIVTEHDVKEPNLLLRFLRKVAQRIGELTDRVARVEGAPVGITAQDANQALSAQGAYPLNVTGLLGTLAQPQPADVTLFTAAPTGQVLQSLRDGQLVVVSGSPDSLYRVVGGNPNSLSQIVAAGAAHNVLSATHTDTVVGAVVRGDIIVGNSTPKWTRLGIGAAKTGLRINAAGTDPEWSAAVAMTDQSNTFTAAQTVSTGGMSVTGGLNAADGNSQITAQRWQHFVLTIANNGGTIQHKIEQWVGSGITGNFCSQINGASATYANTPSVAVGTGFTSGGGILAAATQFFSLDTAAQVDGDNFGICTVVSYTGGAGLVYPTVHWRHGNNNINGVTQRRIALGFAEADSTSVAWSINTTNLPLGTVVIVQCVGLIK